MHRLSIALITVAAVLGTAACSSPATPAGPAPSTAPARPTAGPAAPPAATASSAGQTATGDGRTAPGPYYLGRVDAPVTIEEWADFQ